MIIREILKKENYRNTVTVTSARDMFERLGVKDLDLIEESGPSDVDLILLDMMMPEMDGIQACRILQRSEHLKEIPVIVVTAVGDSHKLAEALDAGAVDYVTKPINKVELMARIRLALRLKLEKDWHRNRDQRIQEELKLASLVQNAVLSAPIRDSEFEIDALYKPSYELAGDLYSWYSLGEGKYAVILLDMMGHGISSSLFCMFISSVLKDTVFTYVEPKLVIEELNRRFIQLHIESKLIQYYFTAIYLVVDTRRKVIEYVNAGHPPALLYTDKKQPVRFDQVGPPVGLFDGIETYPQVLHYEGPGHLVLYTDGLIDGQENSIEARQAWLEEQLKTCSHHFDREAMSRLFFQDAAPLNREDDRCLVWISFK
jgi:sigma-B regulation protein RsbU (phosphoserine phosphatase)